MSKADSVLLVHPLGYRVADAGADISRLATLMPPLGLASIAAYLEVNGIGTSIVDGFARPADCELRIREHLRRNQPDFVGFSCTTSSFLDGIRLAALVKSESPRTRTVIGGPHASALRNRVLEEHDDIDFVVVGEGEKTLRELVESGGRADGIPGLVHRDGGQIVFNGQRTDLVTLDELPFPAYDKLDGFPGRYQLPIFNYPTTPNASCISSRGCPYQCSYCDRSVFRRSFRFNSAEYLMNHLEYLHSRWGIRHVNFYDDQFTFDRERVEKFCRKMIDAPFRMQFNCAVRAEHVDPELLALMRAAGCWMISLGVETGDPDLLAQHRQNADLDLIAERIRQIHAAGIRTKALLMIGLPGETEESFKRSQEYVLSLPIDECNLAKFTPFPGSPLYENIEQFGVFDEDWQAMDCMNFQFVPHGMTRERLETLFKQFYKAHFMRPRILWTYFSMVWKSPDSWRRFFLNLKDFLTFALSGKRIAARRRADDPHPNP